MDKIREEEEGEQKKIIMNLLMGLNLRTTEVGEEEEGGVEEGGWIGGKEEKVDG